MCAEVAHLLHTPLPDLMEMEWQELCAWHAEAARIAKAMHG